MDKNITDSIHPCLALRLANASGLCRPLDHSIPNAIMLSRLLFDLFCDALGGELRNGLLFTGASAAGAGTGEATCCCWGTG